MRKSEHELKFSFDNQFLNLGYKKLIVDFGYECDVRFIGYIVINSVGNGLVLGHEN